MVWVAVAVLTRLNARLRADAHTDGLTGLLNRTGFIAAAARQRAMARRRGEPLALAVIDLDDFKLVNDGGGHAAGDRLLAELAAVWSASCARATCWPGSIAGDEFVLLVTGATEDQVDRVLARFASAHPTAWTAGAVLCSEEESLDEAIARADTRLYGAKAPGRGAEQREQRQRHVGAAPRARLTSRPGSTVPGMPHEPRQITFLGREGREPSTTGSRPTVPRRATRWSPPWSSPSPARPGSRSRTRARPRRWRSSTGGRTRTRSTCARTRPRCRSPTPPTSSRSPTPGWPASRSELGRSSSSAAPRCRNVLIDGDEAAYLERALEPVAIWSVPIATWNVNSVKQRVPRLLPWLDQRRPDVVCLQETKLADDAFAGLLSEELAARGYEVAAHGEPAWNGVAILSRAGLEDVASSGSPDGPGFPAPRGSRRRRHLRRRPRRLGVRAQRATAGLRALPLQARLARVPEGDGGREPGEDGRLRRHEHRPDRRRRLRPRRLHRPDPRHAARARMRSPTCRASACTTSSATAGRATGSSPTGTTGPGCSIRTSGCGST